MARTVSMEALERKIEKAQAQVSKTKKQYDAAISVLSDLLDKRDALRKDELIKLISKSNKKSEKSWKLRHSPLTDVIIYDNIHFR